MATVDSVGKVAYIYDSATNKWYPVAGYASTTVPYSWSGVHDFTNTVNFDSVLNAKAGVNNFLSPNARDAVITAPTNGLVSFVRQTNEGAALNQIQYYFNGAWRIYGDNVQLLSRSANFILSLADAARTIDIESASSVTVTIPTNTTAPFLVGTQIAFIQTGAGQVVFTPASGVTILSKGPGASPTVAGNRKIAARYSPATLIKRDTNTWILIGDLTA
jgi:hypothetical protein